MPRFSSVLKKKKTKVIFICLIFIQSMCGIFLSLHCVMIIKVNYYLLSKDLRNKVHLGLLYLNKDF